jgi:Holliday junction resolvase RusA-like endonuclease
VVAWASLEVDVKFWVPGPLPGMNEIVEAAKGNGGKGYGYATMKKTWTEKVAWHARAAQLHRKPMVRVRLEFLWTEARNANGVQRDPDNIEAGQKFIWDGLKHAGVIPNDTRKENAGTKHDHAVGVMAGVEVTIIDASKGAS